MLDQEIADLLEMLNSGFPDVSQMTGPEARAVVAARRAPVGNLDDVASAEDREIPGPAGALRVRVYQPHGPARPRPVNVFFHGGGFVFCSIETHDGFCREMSRMTDSVVVSVDYRLAPEDRAPAAAYDALAAVTWVAEHADELGADASRLAVSGDSAGGNLAAVVPLMAAAGDGPAIAAQVLIYPVVEASCDSSTYERYETGYFNTAAAMRWYWEQYLPEGIGGPVPEPRQYVEPLAAPSFAGMPPALVVSAALDPLADEGGRLADAMRADGVLVLHRVYAGLFHGFLTIAPLRAAQAARTVLWQDLRALLDVAAPAPGPDSQARQQGAVA